MDRLYLFELLHEIIIAGLALGSVLIAIRYYFKLKKSNTVPFSNVQSEEQKILLPLRLQAYERIILFLERISPDNLVMRLNKTEMTAIQLQSLLVKTIKEEFEYNLSQQIYVSAVAWEMVKNAKEETIKMVNLAAGRIAEDTSSGELVKNIFGLALETERLPVNQAIDEIKKEIRKIL